MQSNSGARWVHRQVSIHILKEYFHSEVLVSFDSKLLQGTGRLFLSQSDKNESHSQLLLLPNGEAGTYH